MQHGGNVFAVAQRNGWDWRDIADFSASINPLGPSPSVKPALEQAFERVVHYPETDASALRAALAEHWHVNANRIVAGNGATSLIHWFARSGDPQSVALAAPVFSEFHRAFPSAKIVPFDVRAWPAEGLVVVTRPANPTGAFPDGLDDYLRSTTNPVMVDESFIEFTGVPSIVTLERPNLFVLRSLTKFYAIPGLRVGALIGPAETLAQWPTEPWTVNVFAEAAVMASIKDKDHARRSVDFVQQERAWLTNELRAIAGVHPQPGVANFLLLALDAQAQPLVRKLESHKLLVRDCSGWPGVPFENAIRIAVRTRAENQRLIKEWTS